MSDMTHDTRPAAPPRRRVLAMGAAMLATSAAAWWGRPQRRDDAEPLALDRIVPTHFGRWVVDQRSEAFVQAPETLGRVYGIYDRVLERHYLDERGERVMLSMAYGGEQSEALQVHRPEVCYASSGFRVGPVSRVTLPVAGRQLPVRQLHAIAPGRSEPVTYWVVLGDEVLADDGVMRWRRVSAGLRGELLDGLLVRGSSLHRDAGNGYRVHAAFAADLAAALAPQWQPRILGRA